MRWAAYVLVLALTACAAAQQGGLSTTEAHRIALGHIVVSHDCDPSLWNHVYAGDPRRFSRPQDRLQVINTCVEVSGTIESALSERDGDIHIRLRLDRQFAEMTNARNDSGQHGDLVLEPVCVHEPTQRDTIDEHSCDHFHQDFDRSLVGQHVRVVGAYVTDMEHGWNEIHPVTSITPDP